MMNMHTVLMTSKIDRKYIKLTSKRCIDKRCRFDIKYVSKIHQTDI